MKGTWCHPTRIAFGTTGIYPRRDASFALTASALPCELLTRFRDVATVHSTCEQHTTAFELTVFPKAHSRR